MVTGSQKRIFKSNMYTAKPSHSPAYKSTPILKTKPVSRSPKEKSIVIEHDDDEDMPSLLARVDEDSDSDDDDNNDTTFTPNPLLTSKQTSLTTPPSLSSSSQLPTPNSNLTTIKLDTTMQYHLKDDKLEALKQRVTSKAIDITSKSTHTHTHPSLSPKRSSLMTTIQIIITSA